MIEKMIGKTRIRVIKGDITNLEEKVDIIVNAANKTLLDGGGVDGAIHAAAGPELLAECRTLSGCETGRAKITKAYKLRAKHVIHTVGPVFDEEIGNENELLCSCYIKSLKLAVEFGLKSIAFPCISTGAYGFPEEKAAAIALKAVTKFLDLVPDIVELIIFVTNTDSDLKIYQDLLDAL